MEKININLKEGMAFDTEVNGHKLTIDAKSEVGGKDLGPRPKPLLLVALGGCTGMDVVSILKKMRVEVKDFNIEVSGEMNDEHPKYYHKLHIKYEFWGENLPLDKIEKAVSLSQERYCGVSFMLGKAAEITHEIVLN
jgi:putative redox protein